MLKKFSSTIIIALLTASTLIAFAFDQRQKAPLITVPEVAFYFAAALICLLPAFYASRRRKSCHNKLQKVA